MTYRILSILTITCIGATSYASNALRAKCFTQTEKNKVKVLRLDREFVKVGRDNSISKGDIAAIVPTNIAPTGDEIYVRDRILAHTSRSLGQSDLAKDNVITRFAKDLEEQVALELGTKTEPSPAAAPAPKIKTKDVPEIVQMCIAPTPIEHKFKLDVKPFKQEARVSYSGFVESQAEYKLRDEAFRLSIRDQLSDHSTIALTHQHDRYGNQQFLHYQVNW